jgi:hypothetical protein
MNIKNADCFTLPERERWRLIASGHVPESVAGGKRPQWEASADKHGYALQNGGISMPREWDLPTGVFYYRFVDSAAYRRMSSAGPTNPALFGGWWIEYEVMRALVTFARTHRDLLESVAGYFLALPREWGDRARLFRASLASPLRAWRGRGKPAQSTSGKYIPPQHRQEIYQCFVPGTAQQRASAFVPWNPADNLIYTRDFQHSAWFS